MSSYAPFPADGHVVRWQSWDGEHEERLSLTWENEAWTAVGDVARERVQYVVRVAPNWRVRQVMLFRDLDEPDLWLANDGHARWGEVNGAHRPELDGCVDVELACTPFTSTLPIRRLPIVVGDGADVRVVTVDVETLAVEVAVRRYERLGAQRWRRDGVELDVDDHGLVVDEPDRFRRM